MFAKMKMKALLGFGFGAMFVIAGVLGYMGWSSLAKVARRVENADDANRIVKKALTGRIAEKNFALRRDKKYLREANALAAEIAKDCDHLKGNLREPADVASVEAVHSDFRDWHAALTEYVEQEDIKDAADARMVKAARAALVEIQDMRADQKAKLAADRKFAKKNRADKLWKADATNRLVKLSDIARLAQLKYMITKDPAFIDEHHEGIERLFTFCVELEGRFKQQVNKDQVRKVLAVAKKYEAAFDGWVAIQSTVEEAKANMLVNAERAVQECMDLHASQKKQLGEELAGGADSAALQRRAGKLDDASHLIEMLGECRLAQVKFMYRPAQEHVETVHKLMADIVALAGQAKAKMKQAANIGQLEQVAAAIAEYGKAFDAYVTYRAKQDDEANEMVTQATQFNSDCKNIRVEQKARLAALDEEAEIKITDRLAKADDANRLNKYMLEVRATEKNYLLRKSPESIEQLKQLIGAMLALADDLKVRFKDPVNDRQADGVIAAVKAYDDAFSNTLMAAMLKQGQNEERMVTDAQALRERAELLRQGQRQKMQSDSSFATTLMLTLAIGAVILGAVLAWWFTRIVTGKLAAETKQLMTASSQLKSAAQQQLSGASEQSTAAGQVSTAMKELAATAEQIVERAQQVTSAAETAVSRCGEGNQSVNQAQEVMQEIREHIEKVVQHMLDLNAKSQEINMATDIITELSEQTTILSYNAAIEAAAAGEAGQSFAVVAEQVGKLADRAKEAAREVRNLIDEVQKATNTTVMATEDGLRAADRGLKAQDEASQTMVTVADGIRASLDSAREIELSSKQQSGAAQQVREGMDNVVTAAKQTETSSKQTLNTADQLIKTSNTLEDM